MTQTRILLVDDNDDHQRLLLRSLARSRPLLNVTLTSCRDGMLQAARDGHYDCVVLDYKVPPYTAPALIEDLRCILPEVPILVISSSEEQGVVIESMRHGVADFVPKSIAMNTDMLWSRIETAIEASKRERIDRRAADRRLKALEAQASTDALTGLHNRRSVEQQLNCERTKSDRRLSTAVIMMDLDHFKAINDNHGHAAGDAVLRHAANILKDHANTQDTIARWGGEEFLILKPSCSLAQAWNWADSVRQSLEAATIEHEGVTIPITACLGVDVVLTEQLNESIMGRADRALYLAKVSGRNRVCTWPMAKAAEIASELRQDPMLSPRQRIEELLNRIGSSLGAVQCEHTSTHGQQVMRIAEQIGGLLEFNQQQRSDLHIAALYHDIGKVAIPEQILSSQRALVPDERRLIDTHAQFGAELARECGIGGRIACAIAEHHNMYEEVKDQAPGDEVTLSMIISIADSMVTMTSQRPYAVTKTMPQALAEIRHQRGRQFHPELVDLIHFISPNAIITPANDRAPQPLVA